MCDSQGRILQVPTPPPHEYAPGLSWFSQAYTVLSYTDWSRILQDLRFYYFKILEEAEDSLLFFNRTWNRLIDCGLIDKLIDSFIEISLEVVLF